MFFSMVPAYFTILSHSYISCPRRQCFLVSAIGNEEGCNNSCKACRYCTRGASQYHGSNQAFRHGNLWSYSGIEWLEVKKTLHIGSRQRRLLHAAWQLNIIAFTFPFLSLHFTWSIFFRTCPLKVSKFSSKFQNSTSMKHKSFYWMFPVFSFSVVGLFSFFHMKLSFIHYIYQNHI